MLPPPEPGCPHLESETDEESSSDSETGGVHGSSPGPPIKSGAATTAKDPSSFVSRALIQMFVFEAIARRLWDAASLAKPHLRRLRMREVVRKEENCHAPRVH